MINEYDIANKRAIIIHEVLVGVVFLLLGCSIYLLFRSKTLNIYQWCITFGFANLIDYCRYAVQDWAISEWIIYSLPDGLYCAAYILIIDVIWYDDNRLIKFAIISIVPIVTISSELFQYFGLVKGTFDVYDLICYIIPPTIYLIYSLYSLKSNIFKIQRL